jgi:hypothetical protein
MPAPFIKSISRLEFFIIPFFEFILNSTFLLELLEEFIDLEDFYFFSFSTISPHDNSLKSNSD